MPSILQVGIVPSGKNLLHLVDLITPRTLDPPCPLPTFDMTDKPETRHKNMTGSLLT